MPDYKYADIKISDDDLARSGADAVIIYDRDVIMQDVCHAIRESGLLTALVAQRDAEYRKLTMSRIARLVEEDSRIKPGTAKMTEETKSYMLVAETREFGRITMEIEA